jgi:hypothetical protein
MQQSLPLSIKGMRLPYTEAQRALALVRHGIRACNNIRLQ